MSAIDDKAIPMIAVWAVHLELSLARLFRFG